MIQGAWFTVWANDKQKSGQVNFVPESRLLFVEISSIYLKKNAKAWNWYQRWRWRTGTCTQISFWTIPSEKKKQNYLFRCPVAHEENFCWNDPKSRVSFTSQPDFSETFCKRQTTFVHKGPFYILAPFPRNFNLHGLASKFSDRGSSVWTEHLE